MAFAMLGKINTINIKKFDRKTNLIKKKYLKDQNKTL